MKIFSGGTKNSVTGPHGVKTPLRIHSAVRTSSLAAALLGWLLLSALNLFVIWALRDRARLIRDNDNERTLNTLFAEMRNYNDFGSAVESNPVLKERITGVAVYESNRRPVYQWGKVPPLFDEEIVQKADRFRFGRYTIPDRRGRSAKFVIHYDRMGPPAGPPPGPQREHGEGRQREFRLMPESSSLFFSSFSRGRYFYTDISHPAYWRARTVTATAFPLVEILLLFFALYIRRLYLRNREYREKIEAQHNLVVLGTAAGTLAHEIKNPLLSIRLQTGILEKLKGEAGTDEINIINQEVDRLSALIYRVNDYLREPAGEKTPLDITDLLRKTSWRLCGVDIIAGGVNAANNDAVIFADENRIRSALENIIRNALESGSPLDGIAASVNTTADSVIVKIVDRGRGIAAASIKRVFDPFFTSKSTGTGIGLAISRRFTEAAGGAISLANREGGGLVVTLVFPLYNKI
ncbi:MAG: HAMP domain-containing histidine kinase [Treponema sp.]|jgi:two-component system sensor histidine kinase HydH|nr:HAMP domain-containing histidine kinase [Treponema sp.]